MAPTSGSVQDSGLRGTQTGGTEVSSEDSLKSAVMGIVTSPQATLPLFRPPQPTKLSRDTSNISQEPSQAMNSDVVPSTERDVDTDAIKQLLASEHGLRTNRKLLEIIQHKPLAPSTRKKAPARKKKGKPKPKTTRPETPTSRSIKSTTLRNSNTPKSASPQVEDDPMNVDGDEDDEEGDDDADDDDDDAQYCICRKGDDHTWMIACDGGCKDWFHGRCVKIDQADEGLIDRYICPNCTKKTGTVTTWKPMCRRPPCRKPARTKVPSKYCSDECGVKFMDEYIKTANAREKKYKSTTPNRVPDEATNHLRGGPMGALALQTVIQTVHTALQFRGLGHALDSLSNAPASTAILSPEEQDEIKLLEAQKEELQIKRLHCKDREQLLRMIINRSIRLYQASEKNKEPCGYDERLSWSIAEIQAWKATPEGAWAFSSNSLDKMPTTNGVNNEDAIMTEVDPEKRASQATTTATPQINGVKEDGEEKLEDIYVDQYICGNSAKKCKIHNRWGAEKDAEVKFDLASVTAKLRDIEKQASSIRHTALKRWRSGFGNTVEKGDTKMELDGIENADVEEGGSETTLVKNEATPEVKMEVDDVVKFS